MCGGAELSAEDIMIWRYVETLNDGLRYLRLISVNRESDSAMLSHIYAAVFDQRPSETFRDFDRTLYAGMKKDDVIHFLDRCYSHLQSMLSETRLILWSRSMRAAKNSPSLADAALFGHIADAFCDADVKDKLYSHDLLMKFFREVARNYFSVDGPNDSALFENRFARLPEASPMVSAFREATVEVREVYNGSQVIQRAFELDLFKYNSFLSSMRTEWPTSIKIDSFVEFITLATSDTQKNDDIEREGRLAHHVTVRGALFSGFIASGFVIYITATIFGTVVILSRRKYK